MELLACEVAVKLEVTEAVLLPIVKMLLDKEVLEIVGQRSTR